MKRLMLLTMLGLVVFSFGVVGAENCTDSDGGRDYFVKGATMVTDAGDSSGEFVDLCNGNNLTERSCYGGGSISDTFACPYGCTNGACIEETFNCLDAMSYISIKTNEGYTNFNPTEGTATVQVMVGGGNNEFSLSGIQFIFSIGGETYIEISEENQGMNQVRVYEFEKDYLKNGDELLIRVVPMFEYRGSENVCDVASSIRISKGVVVVDGPNGTEGCTDSDGGRDLYVKGECSDGAGVHIEDCWSAGDNEGVSEWYCHPDEQICMVDRSYPNAYCPLGCVDGACVSDNGDGTGGIPYCEKNGFDCVDSSGCSDDMVANNYFCSRLNDVCCMPEIDVNLSCCERDKSGMSCQSVGDESFCDVNFMSSPVSCEQTSYCNNDVVASCDSGCLLGGRCFNFGYRKAIDGDLTYCFESGEWAEQKGADESCENSFECDSNLCVSGECVSAGLFKRMMNWFSRLFS